MADRFSLEELEWSMILGCIILAIILLLVNGCAVGTTGVETANVQIPEVSFTPFDLSETTAVTIPVTTEGADSPVTVITFAGAAPWGCGATLALLWGLSKWKGRTTMEALGRVAGALKRGQQTYEAYVEELPDETLRKVRDEGAMLAIESIKRKVEGSGVWRGINKPDAVECLLRKMLKKMK